MKLRILGNSIRFRLSQTEVEQMGERGFCEEKVKFPGGNEMAYRVSKGSRLQADFMNNAISIVLSEAEVDQWVNSGQVSIKGNLALENEDKLSILVEKDFQCLTDRGEDETDLFPNPKESH